MIESSGPTRLTLIDFVKHGSEDKHRIEVHYTVGLRLVKRAVETWVIVQFGGVFTRVGVIRRSARPDDGGVINTKRLTQPVVNCVSLGESRRVGGASHTVHQASGCQ